MKVFQNSGRASWMAAISVLLVGVKLGLCSPPAFAQSNLVYVGSNIGSVPNMNSVFVFSNDGAGNLTQIAGSPFLTGGTGWYDPTLSKGSLDADNALIIDPAGRFLYTMNSHSNTISSFSIAPGGALTLISNPPVPSGGREPISLALSRNMLRDGNSVLAIANKDQDPHQAGGVPSIQTATTNVNGKLKPVKGAKISFPAGDYLASVNSAPLLPKYMFAIQLLGGSEIYTYKIQAHGILEQVSAIGPPAPTDLLLGMAFHPTRHVIYVGIPNGNEIAIYTYSGNGTLTFVNTVADPGNSVCWFAINSAGTRLYSAENLSGTVSVYDITHATAPVFVQSLLLSNQPQGPTYIKIDPTGNFLYALGSANPSDQGAALLHVLNINQTDGTLTETVNPATLNVAQGEHPQGLSVLME